MAGFDFLVGLQIALFLGAVWGAGRFFTICKLPAILGQLAAGIVLGPNFLDMVPYASNGRCDHIIDGLLPYDPVDASGSNGRMLAGGPVGCDDVPWERWVEDKHVPNIWVFAGNVGVTLMIMESGMHIHFDKVAILGKLATVVAVVGTGLPIAIGVAITGALWSATDPGKSTEWAFFPWGLAAGCSFAPTSVGISINLLEESKMLSSDAGQTTLTAAFIDDVFSLVTLVILKTLARGPPRAVDIIVPLICSFAFLGICVFLAIKVFPHLAPKLLSRIAVKKNTSIQPRDEMHLLMMFLTLMFLGWVSSVEEVNGIPFIGSHLLGAFGAGMCWVNVPRSHAIWTQQLKRIVKWLMRIFFAATVGFAIPVKVMFTISAFWRGAVLGIGPCITTKLISGLFARVPYKSADAKALAAKASWATRHLQPQQLLVGIAMVARGEFAYLVAEQMQDTLYQGADGDVFMLSKEVYAAVVWALVMATIVSPLMFRWALGVFDRATPVHRSRFIGGERKEFQRSAFVIRIAAKYSPGVQREIVNTLHSAGVDVLEARLSSVRTSDKPDADCSHFIDHFTVLSRGAKKDFDDEKLGEMQHALSEVLNDENAQIIFEPVDDDYSADGVIEVQILGEHHPAVLHEITEALDGMNLDVIKAAVHHSVQPGHSHHDAHPAPAAAHHVSVSLAEPSEGLRERTSKVLDTVGKTTVTIAKNVLYLKRGQSVKGQGTKNKDREERGHGHQVGRETFYARENDGSRKTDAARRTEISENLRKVLDTHNLHGEVLVRLLHESEMALAHTVPKLDDIKDKERVSVVKCVGKHHKQLLGEICEYIDRSKCDVIHADMDTTSDGKDVNIFYISRTDSAVITAEQRAEIKQSITDMFASHAVTAQVSVISGATLSTPPPTPSMRPEGSPGKRSDWKRGSLDIGSPILAPAASFKPPSPKSSPKSSPKLPQSIMAVSSTVTVEAPSP